MKQIIVHHSASPAETTVQQMNQWHKDRGFTLSSLGWYVGYHYVIESDGIVTQTRKDEEVGCHCVPNTNKIGVCLTGNFGRAKPTEAQTNALLKLLAQIQYKFAIPDEQIYGHRDFKQTECPGKHLYDWLLLYKKWSYLRQQIAKLIDLLKKKQNEQYQDK